MLLSLLAGDIEPHPDLFLELAADIFGLRGCQLDRAVVALDGSFDPVDRHMVGSAARVPRLVAQTTEVLIDPTVAPVATVDKPPGAAAAEDRALEVVGVLLRAIS